MGALLHAARRVARAVRPLVTITAPPDGVVVEHDVEVRVRDGTILRVNVFRPARDGRFPVLMCAHPYGKDRLPRRRGARYAIPRQFRLLPQSVPFTVSAWAGWEAPDPGYWVPRGYVVVNGDLRGWGRSDGVGELLSEQEADDYHDLIEWAAGQPWSTGKVGLNGVSYLAISQWGAASRRPPHLAAICPWEGFVDAYHDFARRGGVREDGFVIMWTALLRLQRRSPVDLRAQQRHRPLFDEWWRARVRDVERVEVPALVCGSFSDHCLHSSGTFEGFERIGSTDKGLYTHRGPKWAIYYSPEALAFQDRFFGHFLKGEVNGMERVPRVRVEVREDARTVAGVRGEDAWPLPGTRWTALALDAATGTLRPTPVGAISSASFAAVRLDAHRGHRADGPDVRSPARRGPRRARRLPVRRCAQAPRRTTRRLRGLVRLRSRPRHARDGEGVAARRRSRPVAAGTAVARVRACRAVASRRDRRGRRRARAVGDAVPRG